MIDGVHFDSKSESFPRIIQKKLDKYRSKISKKCNKSLYQIYREANLKAIKFQRINNYIILAFIVAIALSILGALCNDLWFGHYLWLILEIGGVIVALVLLFYQKVLSHYFRKIPNCHDLWVIERHKAERCRFLKFTDLLWPDPGGHPIYDEKVSEIDSIHEKRDIDKWIVEEALTTHPALEIIEEKIEKNERPDHDYVDIFRYYLCRRLFLQTQYYKNRIARFQSDKYEGVKYFLTGLTIAALGAEILHIIIVFSGLSVIEELYKGIRIGAIVLLLVALIPIISSCLQTFKFARKFQDQAENYLKYFSVLFRHLQNDLLKQEKNSLLEDFMANERIESKKFNSIDFKMSHISEGYNSKGEIYSPGKKIDDILDSLINSCHLYHMIPIDTGKQEPLEQVKKKIDSTYTIDTIIDNANANPLRTLKVFLQCEDTMEQEHQSWVTMMWGADWT